MTGSLRSSRGKFYAILNLKDEFGKRRQKTISLGIDDVPGNRRKAEKALREVLATYEEVPSSASLKSILFCDYILMWLEEAKLTIEQITFEAYDSHVRLHIYPYFKSLGVSLQDLNYQHLQGYYNHKVKIISARSLKKHHCIMNQTLKMALKHDLILSNSAAKVTLPKAKRFVGSYLSVEQGNTLLAVARGTTVETAIVLGMMYGLRRSEIAGLKWSAVDFDGDTLCIEHTVTKFKTLVQKDRTKNQSSHRTLPLSPAVKSYLLNLRAKQEDEKCLLGVSYQNTEYVCRWPDGRPMTPDYLTHAFKKLLRKHGLPNIRLHDLRHSCASYMLKMGCSMKEISDWLGHADIQTAMNVYAHLDFEAKKSVADRFSSILTLNV